MKQQKTRNISWALILVMVFTLISSGTKLLADAKTSGTSYSKQLTGVTDYLKKNIAKPAVGGENDWTVMANSRAGKTDVNWYRAYYDSVYDTVKKNNNPDLGSIGNNAKAVITLTAMGADPTNVAGKNLLQPLSDYNAIPKDYVTTPVYVLLALDSKNYKVPETTGAVQTTRENLVNLIISYFDKNTGSLGGEWGGITYIYYDSMGMAMQALAPYYKSNKDVKSLVDKSLAYLSKYQNSDGTFGGEYDDRVCSTAQVLCALSCLQIDTEQDKRFIKNGKSALDGLLSYAKEDGGIYMEGMNILIDCNQAAYALVSYDRMKNKSNKLYDMKDAVPMFIKLPAAPNIKKVTSPKKKQIKVTWKKKSGINGFQLEVSSKSDFKKSKTNVYKISKKNTSKTVKKSLKSNKTFYARLRTYKTSTVNGVKYTVYSKWSGKKKIRVK